VSLDPVLIKAGPIHKSVCGNTPVSLCKSTKTQLFDTRLKLWSLRTCLQNHKLFNTGHAIIFWWMWRGCSSMFRKKLLHSLNCWKKNSARGAKDKKVYQMLSTFYVLLSMQEKFLRKLLSTKKNNANLEGRKKVHAQDCPFQKERVHR